jgi:hypothetical protein
MAGIEAAATIAALRHAGWLALGIQREIEDDYNIKRQRRASR